MQTLNLGILAHVDAGKTTLTERLLYDAGVIEQLGSVDAGTTQTDTGDLERERGITIRTAVASFMAGNLQINLVDTPGHPDFIAEVERALSVLDGAVLVLSAVEGVQAQTRVLMKSLRRLHLPTLIFVNKVDRVGARPEGLLADIRRKLAAQVIAMSLVRHPGTPSVGIVARSLDEPTFVAEAAELLAGSDDDLFRQLLEGLDPSPQELEALLVSQTNAGVLHPVFFGSALTGQGCGLLTQGIRTLLVPQGHVPEDKAGIRGTVFAVERARGGAKVAYLRLYAGELRDRQRVTFRRREPGGASRVWTGRVTGLEVIGGDVSESGPGGRPPPPRLTAGNIAKVRGLREVRVGDQIGQADRSAAHALFPPPSLETVVRARQPGQEAELHAALASFADEDPLIRTRTAGGGATSVLLYGEVQREVIAARLERDFGVEAVFEPVQPVYFERPLGVGKAITEMARLGANDFWATIGLRVEPAGIGGGVTFASQVRPGSVPLAFHRAVAETACSTLEQGLHGWDVTDCAIILTHLGYNAPVSVAADFRDLTPVVIMRALQDAGTRVYEPCHSFEVEVPFDVLGPVVAFLRNLEADITDSKETALSSWLIAGEIPARRLREFTMALPRLSHGEGALWSHPGTDRPARGVPERPRATVNPLDYDNYLTFLAGRA